MEINEKEMAREIARSLLSIEAVFLRPHEPFTWASGIKSPIYCDNRLTLTAPSARIIVESDLVKIIQKYYPGCQLLMGTSTAGIAHAAISAHLMDLPMGYVRNSKKDHGRTNRIEGKMESGEKTVVIEDLISTGGSVINTVKALRDAGANVLGIASIFTYGMKQSVQMLADHNVVNHSLCDLDTLVDVAAETDYIKPEEKAGILAFRDDPLDESWMSMV